MVWKGDGRRRLAKSLITLVDQVDAKWPIRDRTSDGTIGDARHAATKSEHNPDPNGVVRAIDISHDPAHGVVSRQIAQALLDSRDPRILYLISNGQMARAYDKAGTTKWQWSKYTGVNDHSHHFHLSVVDKQPLYDDTRPWAITGVKPPVQAPASPVPLPTPTPERKIIFEAHGKMSTFGGPNDTGMKPTEGLALWNSAAQMVQHGLTQYLVASQRFPGLGRRLNPDKSYLACRWDYRETPVGFLQNATAYVTNAAGQTEAARPVDWGPNERTGRVTDLSPGLAKKLGLDTNDICTVRIYEDGK